MPLIQLETHTHNFLTDINLASILPANIPNHHAEFLKIPLFIKVEQKNLGKTQLKYCHNSLYEHALWFLLGHSTQERKFTSNYFIWMKAKQSKRFWKRLKLWTLPYFYGTLRKESATSYSIFTIFQADVIGIKPIFIAVFNRYSTTNFQN